MQSSPNGLPQPPSALVVAHPGHEVRLHGWLERARPTVFILTDGSGLAGEPRIGATARYLSSLGLRPGPVFGRFTDTEVYSALLGHDFRFFIELSEELAGEFARAGVASVVADAAEGYNTTHDVCRLVADAAASLAGADAGRRLDNYDFPVVGRPDRCPEHLRGQAVWMELDDETFGRKLSAAREFYPGLFADVKDAVHGRGESPMREFIERGGEGGGGIEAFRVECLRPAGRGGAVGADGGARPFYETLGERQLAAGHVERVIRYREHIAPLASALGEHAERRA